MSCLGTFYGTPAIVAGLLVPGLIALFMRRKRLGPGLVIASIGPALLWGLLLGALIGTPIPQPPCNDTGEPPQPFDNTTELVTYSTLMVLGTLAAAPLMLWAFFTRNPTHTWHVLTLPAVFAMMVVSDLDMGILGEAMWFVAVSAWLMLLPGQLVTAGQVILDRVAPPKTEPQ